MKKALAITIFIISFFIAYNVSALTWTTADSVQIAWEVPTTLSDGSEIPADDLIKTKVWISSLMDKSDKAEVEILPGGTTEYTLTLVDEGRYYVGVQALRYTVDTDGNESFVSESVIAWSDDLNAVANEETFGIVYFLSPSMPTGLMK